MPCGLPVIWQPGNIRCQLGRRPVADVITPITMRYRPPVSGRPANDALVGDLLRSPNDTGRATAFLVLGGNTFGLLAPIVTGYVVAATGSSTPPSPVRWLWSGLRRLWRWCAAHSASTYGRLVRGHVSPIEVRSDVNHERAR